MLRKSSLFAAGAFIAWSAAVSAGQAESISEAFASAYANNPQIASALLSVRSAAEGINLARSGHLPQVSANASLSDNWSVVGGTSTNSTSFNVNGNLSWTIFDGFKTDAQIGQAQAMTNVASQSLRNAEQNVLLSTAAAYANVIRDTRLVQLQADNVSFLKTQVQSANDRLRLGEGTRIAVAQADAQLASTVAGYKTAVESLKISQASYAQFVGHKPTNLSDEITYFAMPNSLDAALSDAENRNPALLAAKAQIQAAQSASAAADAAFGPTLNLIGSICAIQCSGGSGSNGVSGSVRLTLSIPIYTGGALTAQANQANLNQMKSESDALNTLNSVRQSVIAAWSGIQSSLAQIESSQSAITSSRLALEGVIEEQKVGQATTLDVLNARTVLNGVQTGEIQARAGLVTARYSLLAAVGRLSSEDLRLNVSLKSSAGYSESVEDIWSEMRTVK